VKYSRIRLSWTYKRRWIVSEVKWKSSYMKIMPLNVDLNAVKREMAQHIMSWVVLQ
jgi:hypothetical protein